MSILWSGCLSYEWQQWKNKEDYYAGYYWSRNPYDSEYLSTEKTDDELKNKVLQICKEIAYTQMLL